MKFLALLALTLPCWCQQWCGSAVPLPLSATDLSLGSGRQVGVWSIGIRPVRPEPLVLSRVEILERFPELRPLPTWMTVDVLARSAYKDKRSFWARVGRFGVKVGPPVLTGLGLYLGVNVATFSGLGLSGVTAFKEGLETKAPDPVPATAHLLPDDAVQVGPQGGTWIVVSGLVRNAGTLGARCAGPSVSETGLTSPAAREPLLLQPERGVAGLLASVAPSFPPSVYPTFPAIPETLARFEHSPDVWELATKER